MKKRQLKQEEIMSVKRKESDLGKVIATLKSDIEECTVEASTKEDFESMKLCLEKGYSFRTALKEKEKTLAALQKAVKKLEEELKNC